MSIFHQFHRPVEQSGQRGFVLIATLALLGLAVTTVIVVTSLMNIESELTAAQAYRKTAQKHALSAMEIALGQLQFYAGTDQVNTLPAETFEAVSPLHPHWTYVEGVNASASAYLVSSNGTPNALEAIAQNLAVDLVGSGTVGPAGQLVTVEKVPITTSNPYIAGSPQNSRQTGHLAYWVGELNTRANVHYSAPDETLLTVDDYSLSVSQLNTPRRSAIEAAIPGAPNPDASPDPDSSLLTTLAKVSVDDQLFEYFGNSNQLKSSYWDVTTHSLGVLSNPLTGGLKVNLTDTSYSDALITPAIRAQIGDSIPYFVEDTGDVGESKIDLIEQSLPFLEYGIEPEETDIPGFLTPAITEFSLSVGIFHTQSDRRHRLRYHMYVEWLNPYPFDMGFDGSYPWPTWVSNPDDRGYIIILDNLPAIEVTNLSSNQQFTVDLNDFDESMSSNTSNESQVNSWMSFAELSSPGGGLSHGIDASSNYRMAEPDPIEQPRGLARTIAESPNLWQWGGATAPVSGPRPANTIYGNDSIRIRAQSASTVDLYVVPFRDSIPSGTIPNQYIQQHGYALHLKDIPFEAFSFNIQGSTYSRSTSGSYTPADNRIRFQFKIGEDEGTPENHAAFQEFARLISIRNPVIDFSDPDIAALWEIDDVRGAATGPEPLTNFEIFYDDDARENDALSSDETEFNLVDLPFTSTTSSQIQPTSAGVFASLPRMGEPEGWTLSEDAPVSEWAEVFDRYYFSGTSISSEWQTLPQAWDEYNDHPLANPRIIPIVDPMNQYPLDTEVTAQTGASVSMVKGSFNIHSASEAAWLAILKNVLLNNPTLDVSGEETSPNVVAKLPFGSPSIANQLPDSAFEGSTDEALNRGLYRQGLRSLDDDDTMLRAMAQGIISRTQGRTFSSIAAFINSGILEDAIAEAELNFGPEGAERIHGISPGFLRQADFFNYLGPILTTRSDTFVIRAYGEAQHPRSGATRARAFCEAIVQRYPKYVDDSDAPSETPTSMLNQTLGRRFKVVSFRWLQPHEI
jgi:Tfp pilus assembly protein PilX